jgi:hypothetical protein
MPKMEDLLVESAGGRIRMAHNFMTGSAKLVVGNSLALSDHLAIARSLTFIPDADGYITEAQRHTFNYLMSAIALRDLTRRVLKLDVIKGSGLPEGQQRTRPARLHRRHENRARR